MLEVLRTDRRGRRLRGNSETLDAENAARAVINGTARSVPKSADGVVEMIRNLKVAKDVAVKVRTSAVITLKQVLVNAPPELREELQPLTKMTLIRRCAALRPGTFDSVQAAVKYTLRSIARRRLVLHEEIRGLEAMINELTTQLVPQLVTAFGFGPDVAAELLIVAGDNTNRVHSESAWARLCGVAPIPASSGMVTRHPINKGGHRQANAALYRVAIVRMQHHEPTRNYVNRRTAEGKSKKDIIRAYNASSHASPGRCSDHSVNPRRPCDTPLDSYRSINAAAEILFGLLKTEVIRPRGPWKSIGDVELATLEWVDWYNHVRLHSHCGDRPPVEYEAQFHCRQHHDREPVST